MLNNLSILGRVTKPLELKYTKESLAVLEFDIANSTKSLNKETTTFLRCVLYGRGAEVFNQFVKKGDRVLLQGELRQNSYTDKSGSNRSYHFLHVNTFDFIESKGEQSKQQESQPKEPTQNTGKQSQVAQGLSLKDLVETEFNEIPF